MSSFASTKTIFAPHYGAALKERVLVPKNIAFLIVCLDVFALVLAFYGSLLVKNMWLEGALADSLYQGAMGLKRQHVFVLLGFAVLLTFSGKGLYTQRIPWWTQVQFILKICIFAFFADGFLSFALKLDPSRLVTVLNWVLAGSLMITSRYTLCMVGSKSGLWGVPTILIGSGAVVTDALYAFSADLCAPYQTQAILLRNKNINKFDIENLPKKFRRIPVHDGYGNYEEFIRRHPHNFYVISLETFRGRERESLVKLLNSQKIAYALIPTIANMNFYQMEPHYFFGQDIMLLQGRNSVFSPLELAVKRAMDIVISGLLLIALAPFFLVIMALLKLEGQQGSPFYDGKRIGRKGRHFRCWKFRTMQPGSDHLLHAYLESNPGARAHWEKYHKLPDDPRITSRTARFVRKASIDELPQLWNVLIGEMSLVGPRPILEDEAPLFGDRIEQYISVRPGITGLWQVSGRNATSFERRVHWDSWYVRNWSLWGDIVILIKTPFVLLSRADAY